MKLSIVNKDGSLSSREKPLSKSPVFRKPDLSGLKMPKVRLPKWTQKAKPAPAKSRGTDSADLEYMKLKPKAATVSSPAPKLKSVPTAPLPAKPRQKSVPIGSRSDAGSGFKGPSASFAPKVQQDSSYYEVAAKEVIADLKAGRIMRGSSGKPVTDKLSTRDLSYKAGGSPSREAIMALLRSWGVVKSQGPRKAHIVATAYRFAPEVKAPSKQDSYRRDAIDALDALGIKNGRSLVDATTGSSGEEWTRNALKMHKSKA